MGTIGPTRGNTHTSLQRHRLRIHSPASRFQDTQRLRLSRVLCFGRRRGPCQAGRGGRHRWKRETRANARGVTVGSPEACRDLVTRAHLFQREVPNGIPSPPITRPWSSSVVADRVTRDTQPRLEAAPLWGRKRGPAPGDPRISVAESGGRRGAGRGSERGAPHRRVGMTATCCFTFPSCFCCCVLLRKTQRENCVIC